MIRPSRVVGAGFSATARLALVLALISGAPVSALAQTASSIAAPVAGAGLQNRAGALSLPALAPSVTTATSAAAASTTAAGPNAGGATGGGSGRASSGGTGAGSSGSPGAASGGSGPAPAWLLCPPPGATGEAPFVTGTALSCAP